MEIFEVKVKTNASKNEVKLIDNKKFFVKTTATPEKGRANKQVILLLAKFYKISKNQLEIVRGLKSKNKVIKIFYDKQVIKTNVYAQSTSI